MRLLSKILLLTIVLLTFNTFALAVSKTINVQWSYDSPSTPAVTGFELYQEGVKICSFIGSSITTGDCLVTLVKEKTIFTLTAKFSDGTESPHSSPYTFGYTTTFDKTLFPVVLQVQIN